MQIEYNAHRTPLVNTNFSSRCLTKVTQVPNTLEHSRPTLLWLQVICRGTPWAKHPGTPWPAPASAPATLPGIPAQMPQESLPPTFHPLNLQLSCQGVFCAKSPGLPRPMPTSALTIPPGLPQSTGHPQLQPASQNHQVLQSAQGMIIHKTISSSLEVALPSNS